MGNSAMSHNLSWSYVFLVIWPCPPDAESTYRANHCRLIALTLVCHVMTTCYHHLVFSQDFNYYQVMLQATNMCAAKEKRMLVCMHDWIWDFVWCIIYLELLNDVVVCVAEKYQCYLQ